MASEIFFLISNSQPPLYTVYTATKLRPQYSFSGNICFEISVFFCLCLEQLTSIEIVPHQIPFIAKMTAEGLQSWSYSSTVQQHMKLM